MSCALSLDGSSFSLHESNVQLWNICTLFSFECLFFFVKLSLVLRTGHSHSVCVPRHSKNKTKKNVECERSGRGEGNSKSKNERRVSSIATFAIAANQWTNICGVAFNRQSLNLFVSPSIVIAIEFIRNDMYGTLAAIGFSGESKTGAKVTWNRSIFYVTWRQSHSIIRVCWTVNHIFIRSHACSRSIRCQVSVADEDPQRTGCSLCVFSIIELWMYGESMDIILSVRAIFFLDLVVRLMTYVTHWNEHISTVAASNV